MRPLCEATHAAQLQRMKNAGLPEDFSMTAYTKLKGWGKTINKYLSFIVLIRHLKGCKIPQAELDELLDGIGDGSIGMDWY